MDVDGRPQKTLEIRVRSQEEEEEEELEKLEADVAELADRIVRYRRKIPHQLKAAFYFLTSLESLDLSSPAEAGAASASGGGELSGSEISSLSSRNEEAAREKIELLKQKTLVNASAVGPFLKRMRDCISRIDNVHSSKGSIHPVFKASRWTHQDKSQSFQSLFQTVGDMLVDCCTLKPMDLTHIPIDYRNQRFAIGPVFSVAKGVGCHRKKKERKETD